MNRRISLAIAASLLMGLPLSASALSIDEFTTSQSVFVPAGPPTPQTATSNAAAPEAVGGSREIILERTAGFGIASVDSNLSGDGYLSMSTAAAVAAVTTLVYDGGADGSIDPSGLGGVDVTDAGASSVLRIVARSDLDATIRVQFHSGSASDYLFAEFTLPGSGTGDGPFTTLEIPLASLTANGSGADLTDVGAILAVLDGPASLDLQVDSIATVPEPASLVLMGLGLAGITVAGRRRSA